MMSMSLLLISLMGFAALALGMSRHAKDVLGVVPSPGQRRGMRAVGWCLLGGALAFAMSGWGHTVGIVEWTAALTAATVPLVMLVLPRLAGRPSAGSVRNRPGQAAVTGEKVVRGVPGRVWAGLRTSGLVVLPVAVVWAFIQVPPSPVQRSDAVGGQAGPWTFVLAEIDRKPPVPSALDTAMKGFQVRFCEGCDAQIREAYLKIRQPRSLRGAGMSFFGPAWNRRVEIQIAPTAREEDGLWLTVEGLDGSVHQVEIDLARISPVTARYIAERTSVR